MKRLLCMLLLLPFSTNAAPVEDFTVKSATDKSSFRLAEARGKFVALHFLLKTECPYCLRFTQEYISKAGGLPAVIHVFLKPDTDAEIEKWASKIPAEMLATVPIYRDVNAKLADAFEIPDGYKFHGQEVHFPALVLIDPDGQEAFRYVGKNNGDRLPFEKLAEKVAELAKK